MKNPTLNLTFLLLATCQLFLALPSSAQYCNASGPACNIGGQTYIERFVLADFMKTSSCGASPSSPGYSDFTADTIKVVPGSNHLARVYTTPFWEADYIYIYIDWNSNGDLEDPGEAYQVSNSPEYQFSSQFSIPITIPDTLTVGRSTRLRIRHFDAANDPAILVGPCGTTAFGEVEDYTIRIVEEVKYCEARGGDCSLPPADPANPNTDPDFDHITTATIESEGTDVTNASGCNNGYGDFTKNKSLMATWNVGATYSITVRRRINYTHGRAGAWVDWNEDGDFEDQDEVLAGNYSAPLGYGRFQLTVPASAASGLKRLRIRTTNFANAALSCGLQLQGEVEDYSVIVSNPVLTKVACISGPTIPANNAINQCQKLPFLNWDDVTDATGYKVTLHPAGTANYIFKDSLVAASAINLSTVLQAGTVYKWIVIPTNDDGDAFNCDTLQFTTSPNGDPVPLLNPDVADICRFEILSLDGNPQGGTAPYTTHLWTALEGSPIAKLNGTGTQVVTFNGDATGTFKYLYTVTDNNSCRGSDSIIINVSPSPEITQQLQTADNSICIGDIALLSVLAAAGSTLSFEDSSASHGWQPAVGVINTSGANYKTSQLSETTFFRAKASFPGGCSTLSNEVEITANPLPAAPIVVSDAQPVNCEGSVVTLVANSSDAVQWNDVMNTTGNILTVTTNGAFVATATDGNGCKASSVPSVVNFTANPQKVPIVVSGNNPACAGDFVQLTVNTSDRVEWNDASGTTTNTLVVYQPGSFTATLSNADGCETNTDPVTISFVPLPQTPVITIQGNNPACDGESVLLSTSGNGTFTWSDAQNTTGSSLSVMQAGSFTVTVTDANGCSSTSTAASVSFKPVPPKPTVSINAPNPLCEGDQAQLTSSYGNNNTWSNGSSDVSAGVTTSGAYTVTYTAPNGCTSTSDPAVLVFGVRPEKPAIIQQGNTITSSVEGDRYQWSNSSGLIIGAESRSYNPPVRDEYQVTVYSAEGCASEMSEKHLFSGVGLKELQQATIAQLYPNPNNGKFVLDLAPTDGTMILKDLSGKEVYRANVSGGLNTIDLPLEKGMYLLFIQTDHAYQVIPMEVLR